jgi:PAS domain S-box-containing protein
MNDGFNGNWPELQTAEEAEAALFQLANVFFGSVADGQPLDGSGAGTLLDKPDRPLSSDEQVRLVEARYRNLVEQIPVVTFIAELNQESNEIYVSPQIEAMLGYSQREWIENPVLWYERLHPDDKERWTNEITGTLTLNEPFQGIYRFLARDGHIVWVRGEIKVIYDQYGIPSFIQGVGFDVSEIKRAEEANALLAAIVESSGDAIIGKTLNGLIVSWNPGAERIYGYTEDEVMGQPISMLMPPEHSAESTRILETIRQGERMAQDEAVHLTKDGRRIVVSLTVSPIRDADGKLLGASTIARDITERKEAEDRIRASLKEKETLLKEVHHRVKNNLQITSSLFSLQSAATKDEAILDIFRQSSNRIQSMALVHEKLYSSANLSQIDASEYIKSLVPNLLLSYGPRAANISLHWATENLWLEIDKAIPLGLIINELVSNCAKHAFAAGARGDIWIDLQREHEEVVVVVADNGVGFPDGLDFQHTGTLGLQLVNTLTNQLKGTIEMRSNGKTEFRIRFRGA